LEVVRFGPCRLARGLVKLATVGSPPAFFIPMKRIFDLTIAVLVIVCVLSWLLPILAFLVIWDSEGPVFFVQKRVGRYSRLFSCYKLRTMVVNEQADRRPARGDDARITRLGSWLRRSHVDELPQFFNVLLGSMSIVGPRPYMPADCRRFATMVPDDSVRYLVRPGITGLAQARGLHDVFCDREVIQRRYQCDAYYVANAGVRLDLYILARTVVRIPYACCSWLCFHQFGRMIHDPRLRIFDAQRRRKGSCD
jgi:putative colanic acid biosynthesis UDP-glucose lipid carrier transferase